MGGGVRGRPGGGRQWEQSRLWPGRSAPQRAPGERKRWHSHAGGLGRLEVRGEGQEAGRCPRRLLLWTREEVRVCTGQVPGTEGGPT